MATTKEKQQQQKLLVIYLTICLAILSLIMNVDSVSAFSTPLDGSGSMSQHHEQQQVDNNVQEQNYITDQMNQRPSDLTVKNHHNAFGNDNAEDINNDNDIDGDGDGDGNVPDFISRQNIVNDDLIRNQFDFGQPFKPFNVMIKKTPGGFVGMRGKKLYNGEDDNMENREDFNNYNFPWNQLQTSKEDLNWSEYTQPNTGRFKKASTAFYGVRGKKFTTLNGANSHNDNHRWNEFLQKLEEERVRDALLQDLVDRLAGTKNDLTNDFSKRAPTGFTGVRGKRPLADPIDTPMETLDKRGLGNNAFFGVRGKKDVSHQAFKRSPPKLERNSYVFWKKSLSGRNGKRQNLSNKFIAVRGKKTTYDELSPSAAVSLVYGKRVPNGFLGMRGKRPFTTGDI